MGMRGRPRWIRVHPADPSAYLATAGPADRAIIALRPVHVLAVLVGVPATVRALLGQRDRIGMMAGRVG
jgi:hypothetical protein